MKQTAVEWLEKEVYKRFGGETFLKVFANEFKQAKAMEKEQIIDAYQKGFTRELGNRNEDSEQYYNETYLQTHTPKHYRVWFPDTMEAAGGFWWHAVTDSCGKLYDPNHPNEKRDTVQWYIDNGYKIEEVKND